MSTEIHHKQSIDEMKQFLDAGFKDSFELNTTAPERYVISYGGEMTIWQNTSTDMIITTSTQYDVSKPFVTIISIQPMDIFFASYATKQFPHIFSPCRHENMVRFNVRIQGAKALSKLIDKKLKHTIGIKEYSYDYNLSKTTRYIIFKNEGDYAFFLFLFSSHMSPA